MCSPSTYADQMLIGACNPMLCPIHVFRQRVDLFGAVRHPAQVGPPDQAGAVQCLRHCCGLLGYVASGCFSGATSTNTATPRMVMLPRVVSPVLRVLTPRRYEY